MSVFRVEKNNNFTIMSNHHLRDKNLSNRAKGLLSIMLSLPEEWDYTTEGLVQICKDGYDSIRAQLHELESFGYVTRERSRNEKGQLKGCDYTIHEIPITMPDSSKLTKEKPTWENPTQVNPTYDNPTQEIPRQSNTDISNTNQTNTYSINNQSINLDVMDRADVEEAVAEQIEFDSLTFDCSEEQVKEIVSVIADVICSSASAIKVNGTYTRKEDVVYRFSQLNEEHIRYVIDAMEKSKSEIRNIRAYLLTALYNAPATMDNYYTALFNAHQKGLS